MTKFKVGDKVRILDASQSDHQNGDVGEIIRLTRFFGALMHEVNVNGNVQGHFERDNELVSDKPTKNQRITKLEQNVVSLESEVAELKAKVEALEKAQKPSYQIGVDFARPSPNEQRKAIIAEAKTFIDDSKVELTLNRGRGYVVPFKEGGDGGYICDLDFVVNAEKRTVVALLRWTTAWESEIKAKGIAKCAPDDVFNADIGKAIALGRALGLDVSRFEQAVKPTEVVVGQVVHKTQGVLKGSVGPVTSVGDPSFMSGENGLTFAGDKSLNGDYVWSFKEDVEIISDTEAVY